MTELEAVKWLKERDNFLILTHIRPDGDTMGSAVGLCLALQKIGKTAYMLRNSGITAYLDKQMKYVWSDKDYKPEHIIAVDMASESMFPDDEHQNYKGCVELCIDHHISNTHYAKNLCLDADASACAMIIYRIVLQLTELDADIARALYIGTATDTGCFMHSNTLPETHLIAADLMRYVDVAKINKHFFKTKSRAELKLEARVMSNAQFYDSGKICISYISMKDKEELQVSNDDCEGISSFIANIEGVECGALIRELTAGKCKISLRSETDYINSNKVCGLMGGGGHPAASGAKLDGDVLQVCETVLKNIERIKAEQ